MALAELCRIYPKTGFHQHTADEEEVQQQGLTFSNTTCQANLALPPYPNVSFVITI